MPRIWIILAGGWLGLGPTVACAQGLAAGMAADARPISAASPAWPAAAPPVALDTAAVPPAVVAPSAAPPEKKQTPLPPPSRRVDPAQNHAATGVAETRPSPLPSMLTLGTSLAIVLGLFLAAAWLLRKTGAGNVALLPKEAVEVLGRAVLVGRHQVHLVRCGNKLLLVAISPAGIETLTEVTEPQEVDRLAGLCQQTRPDSASAAFRQVFQQFIQAKPVRRAGRKGAIPVDELDLANADIPDIGGELRGQRHA